MSFLERIRALGRVMRRGGNPELTRLLRRRPGVLLGAGAYELGLLASNRLDARLKALAQVKVSALVGCPF